MDNNTVINIAKKYGYHINKYTLEGVVFDEEELPLDKTLLTKEVPKQILGISAEIQDSEDIFGIFTDADNPTVNNIIAIEVINMTNHTSELLDLDLINLYNPLYDPKEEIK
ncbi:MAG: hypothetical protein ACRCX8_12040 [Sarcina sp.]